MIPAIADELRAHGACIRHPAKAFRSMAEDSRGLIDALSRMLLWRVPLAAAEGLLAFWSLGRMYRSLADPSSSLWQAISGSLPADLSWRDLEAMLRELPPFPEASRALPWILLLAPIYVLSLWLHDAVWDHGCLWILKGTGRTHGFRLTMLAEAEALRVGSLGALVGLLAYLPVAGLLLAPIAGMVGLYFWVLRGFSLSAFHRCPLWKGVGATLLHGALMLLGGILMLALLALVVGASVA